MADSDMLKWKRRAASPLTVFQPTELPAVDGAAEHDHLQSALERVVPGNQRVELDVVVVLAPLLPAARCQEDVLDKRLDTDGAGVVWLTTRYHRGASSSVVVCTAP